MIKKLHRLISVQILAKRLKIKGGIHMKKSKKQNLGKKLLSSILSATMAAELIPGMALNVNAEVNKDLVSALTEAYDGDEARAAEELELLHQAGIIDENGNEQAVED